MTEERFTQAQKLVSIIKTKPKMTASSTTLAKEMGCSTDHLRKLVQRARAAGYSITTIQPVKNRPARYQLGKMTQTAETVEDAVRSAIGKLDTSSFRTPKYLENIGKSVIQEEAMVVVIGDTHVGRRTISYSYDVFLQRLNVMEHSIMKIVNLHRHYCPIKKLVIILVGDIVDGEEIYRGHGYEVEYGVLQQSLNASKEIAAMVQRLSAKFLEVEVLCAPGNHGRGQWKGDPKTNWDLVAYTLMDVLLQGNERVSFHYPNKTKGIILHEIMGHPFLVTHGNQVKMWNQFPWYGLTNKAMRWLQSIGEFEYMVVGHFHVAALGVNWNAIQIIANGTFMTDDDWSIETIGLTGSTVQIVFGVNRKYGITWRYEIDLLKEADLDGGRTEPKRQ